MIETRHVKTALKAMTVKTDRNDARGMAQLMRMGWFRPVHVKTPVVQEIRALLTARKLLITKLRDVESSLRGILRGFGLKVGVVSKKASSKPVSTSSSPARPISSGSPSRCCGPERRSAANTPRCTASSSGPYARTKSALA